MLLQNKPCVRSHGLVKSSQFWPSFKAHTRQQGQSGLGTLTQSWEETSTPPPSIDCSSQGRPTHSQPELDWAWAHLKAKKAAQTHMASLRAITYLAFYTLKGSKHGPNEFKLKRLGLFSQVEKGTKKRARRHRHHSGAIQQRPRSTGSRGAPLAAILIVLRSAGPHLDGRAGLKSARARETVWCYTSSNIIFWKIFRVYSWLSSNGLNAGNAITNQTILIGL